MRLYIFLYSNYSLGNRSRMISIKLFALSFCLLGFSHYHEKMRLFTFTFLIDLFGCDYFSVGNTVYVDACHIGLPLWWNGTILALSYALCFPYACVAPILLYVYMCALVLVNHRTTIFFFLCYCAVGTVNHCWSIFLLPLSFFLLSISVHFIVMLLPDDRLWNPCNTVERETKDFRERHYAMLLSVLLTATWFS